MVGPTVTKEDRLGRSRQQVGEFILQPTGQTELELSAPKLQVDSLPADLPKLQHEDLTLVHCFKEAEKDPSDTVLWE